MTNGRLLVVTLALTSAGCSVVSGIFKAGVWVGLILAVIIVVGVFILFRGRG
jgi:hypothetical protein